jgi:hypothetical protein
VTPVTAQNAAPGDARAYLGKAIEFLEAAETALAIQHFSAAVGNACHAGISAADAISAARLGKVWKDGHSGAVDHVKQAGAEGKQVATQLRRLLKLKARAEYDPKPSSEAHATSAVTAAQRIRDYAAAVLSETTAPRPD